MKRFNGKQTPIQPIIASTNTHIEALINQLSDPAAGETSDDEHTLVDEIIACGPNAIAPLQALLRANRHLLQVQQTAVGLLEHIAVKSANTEITSFLRDLSVHHPRRQVRATAEQAYLRLWSQQKARRNM